VSFLRELIALLPGLLDLVTEMKKKKIVSGILYIEHLSNGDRKKAIFAVGTCSSQVLYVSWATFIRG